MLYFSINRLAAVAIAVSSLLAGTARAQDSVLDQARLLLRGQDASGAHALLAQYESQRAGEPAFDYLLGISAMDSGHISPAIFALERVVGEQPENNLARAELARALFAAGDTEAARKELETARRGAMPAEAAAAIDRVLGSIAAVDESRLRTVRGYVEVTVGHDSNLNSATATSAIALPTFGGMLFTLDPASQQRQGSFGAVSAGAEIHQSLGRGWKASASFNGRRSFNETARDLDQRQGDVSVGAAHSNEVDTYSLALQSNTFWLDNRRFRVANGGSVQWQRMVGSTSQITGFAQWSRLTYPGQEVRNADRTVLGAGFARALNEGRQVVYGSVFGARERERTEGYANFGHLAAGARAGIEHSVAANTTLYSTLQFERRNYGGEEPFFNTSRRDRQVDLLVGLNFVPAPMWRVSPQVVHTRANSNVTLFDYRRTVVQISVRREFQ